MTARDPEKNVEPPGPEARAAIMASDAKPSDAKPDAFVKGYPRVELAPLMLEGEAGEPEEINAPLDDDGETMSAEEAKAIIERGIEAVFREQEEEEDTPGFELDAWELFVAAFGSGQYGGVFEDLAEKCYDAAEAFTKYTVGRRTG